MKPSDIVAAIVRIGYRDTYDGRREVAESRFAICATCPELGKGGLCKNCGCYMPGKVWILGASCPVKKWDAGT